MELSHKLFLTFRGEYAVKKYTYSAFRIRTEKAYVGLGLINCVLIFVAFILLQYIHLLDYSAVGLDGEIFEPVLTPFSCDVPGSSPQSPSQHRVSGQIQS
jgi:hypothetical protein